jgi:hypothetical protein
MFRRFVGVVAVLLTLGAVGGLIAYFELAAPRVPGTITDKQERIIGGRHAAPGRYLATAFKLQGETEEDRYLHGSPNVADIQVDQPTYDSHATGQSVTVRYLPFNPDFARLDGQPLFPRAVWLLVAAAILGLASLIARRTRVAALLCMCLLGAVLVARPGPPPSETVLASLTALFAIVLATAVAKRGGIAFVMPAWIVVTTVVLIVPVIRGGSPTMQSAIGEIRDATVFRAPTTTRSPNTLTTLQAFDRVHVAFTPGADKPQAFVLDFIDHGSAGDLKNGAKVPIEYDPAHPRHAHLTGGSRTHYWKNAAIPTSAVLGLALLLARKKPKSARAAAGMPRTR